MKNFFKIIFRRIIGIIILPLLYVRYSFVAFIPLMIMDGKYFGIWLLYALTFSFVMGNLGGMSLWSSLFEFIFQVDYEIKDDWQPDALHSHSVWWHPVLNVRGKDHKLSISISGGNLYEADANITRKAIFYWFFT